MKKLVSTLMMSLLIAGSLQARQTPEIQPRFTGTIVYPENTERSTDSLIVHYNFPYAPVWKEFKTIRLTTDQNGNFHFNLPAYDQPIILQIMLKNKKYFRLCEHYFTNRSDSIHIQIFKNKNGNPDSAKFYGKGAENYNIVARLEELMEQYKKEMGQIKLGNPDSIQQKLQRYDQLSLQMEQKKAAVINSTITNPAMRKLVEYEYCRINNTWQTTLYWLFKKHKDNPAIISSITQHYNRNLSRFNHPYDPLMELCTVYMGLMANQEAQYLAINSPAYTVKLNTFYQHIKSKYTGPVKERLLTNLFMGGNGLIGAISYQTQEFDSLLTDAAQLVTIPFLKQSLGTKLRTMQGKKLLVASFTDINGNQVSTASLKNQVVLIDFWGLGCSFCTVFHRFFTEKIYPSIKDNRDFVYLSVGTDKKKENWLKGIHSGKYTHPNYLNVYTGGLGLSHPFLDYYNVQSLPYALLIDREGNIFDSTVLNTKNTFRLITEALNKAQASK